MNLPEGAVRVRADQVRPAKRGRPGDVLWIEGEEVGEVTYSRNRIKNEAIDWCLSAGYSEFVRKRSELVWVVRPEPTVTLTITLPEAMVRHNAGDPVTYGMDDAHGFGHYDQACREWVAANPQDERSGR